MKGLDAFENFYKHYNKAALDKLSLEKEKQMLNHENTQLRSILKQYLDGISVNSDVLAQTNPLLIINNRANVRFEFRFHLYFNFFKLIACIFVLFL